MKTITYKLRDNHTGVAEIDKDDVILYIQNNRRIFFNLIPWVERVIGFEVFTLSTKDEDRGVCIERFIHGLVSRPQLRKRNIDTFDIKAELERMYETYAAEKKRREDWEKRLEKFN